MANSLNMSVSGYNKIEKNDTHITLEKIVQIANVLEMSVAELLETESTTIYNQTLKDSAVGHQQIENLYHDNKDLTQKLINVYKDEIAFYRSKIEITEKK